MALSYSACHDAFVPTDNSKISVLGSPAYAEVVISAWHENTCAVADRARWGDNDQERLWSFPNDASKTIGDVTLMMTAMLIRCFPE